MGVGYPQGGGLTAKQRQFREHVRLSAIDFLEAGDDSKAVAKRYGSRCGSSSGGVRSGKPTVRRACTPWGKHIPWGRIDPFYAATVQAVEEAVLNTLVAAEETIGRDGHRTPALPHDRLRSLLHRTSPLV